MLEVLQLAPQVCSAAPCGPAALGPVQASRGAAAAAASRGAVSPSRHSPRARAAARQRRGPPRPSPAVGRKAASRDLVAEPFPQRADRVCGSSRPLAPRGAPLPSTERGGRDLSAASGLRLTRVGPESGRLGCADWHSPPSAPAASRRPPSPRPDSTLRLTRVRHRQAGWLCWLELARVGPTRPVLAAFPTRLAAPAPCPRTRARLFPLLRKHWAQRQARGAKTSFLIG